jgi:hypothetical protein
MRRVAPKCPLLLAQAPGEQNSLCVREAAPVLQILPIRISIAGEPAHGYPRVVPLAPVVIGHDTIIADYGKTQGTPGTMVKPPFSELGVSSGTRRQRRLTASVPPA